MIDYLNKNFGCIFKKVLSIFGFCRTWHARHDTISKLPKLKLPKFTNFSLCKSIQNDIINIVNEGYFSDDKKFSHSLRFIVFHFNRNMQARGVIQQSVQHAVIESSGARVLPPFVFSGSMPLMGSEKSDFYLKLSQHFQNWQLGLPCGSCFGNFLFNFSKFFTQNRFYFPKIDLLLC